MAARPQTPRAARRRAVGAVVALAAVLLVAACGSSSSDDASESPATPTPATTPMDAADAAPALRMTGQGLRGNPPNMYFVRITSQLNMSLAEDGNTVWSVTRGIPVRFSHDRAECRYPAIDEAEFTSIAGQVLWSATPPRDFPGNGTWGFLGTRADADAGTLKATTYTYDSGGRVTLTLDAQDRPVYAQAPRGPFTIVYGRYSVATVANAEGLPACP
ncbi:MAG: hypothetical protein AB7I08_02335 [Thermoleophilia bacterium]